MKAGPKATQAFVLFRPKRKPPAGCWCVLRHAPSQWLICCLFLPLGEANLEMAYPNQAMTWPKNWVEGSYNSPRPADGLLSEARSKSAPTWSGNRDRSIDRYRSGTHADRRCE